MYLNKAEEIIKEKVEAGNIPGATYCVVDMKCEEHGFYGYKQLVPSKELVNQDTLYDLASLTKVVATTTMILKLIEENYFNLETKLISILPDFNNEEITIKNLLTHTSGLAADNKDYRKTHDKDEMYEFIKSLGLEYKTNSQVLYSDFNYILLGRVIEKFKGNLEDYANELIFKPLGMNDTMYNPHLKGRSDDCATAEVTEARGVIKGVVHDGKGFILKGISGNAGLFSNTKDLAKFVRMILNDGYPVLKKESIDLFKRSMTDGLNLNRTIGWCVACDQYAQGKLYSDTAIFHTGFSGTSIYIDFVRKMGIILLTNRVHPLRREVKYITEVREPFHDAILKAYDEKN